MRATKVVVTLGPSSDSYIENLLLEGVDVFRLNFSHGSLWEQEQRIKKIRAAAFNANRVVAILGDLQGPKIRIGSFLDKSIQLTVGETFAIDGNVGLSAGDNTEVGCTHVYLADQLSVGDVLVLGDGEVELEVRHLNQSRIQCLVLAGHELSSGKGINLRGGGLSLETLTKKDLADLEFACQQGLDYVAVSFVKSADDIHRARALITGFDAHCGIVAKIERAEAVASTTALDAIIRASDGVMVARGDLGIEIGDAALMGVQKRLIKRATELGRSVITATQMMESMVNNPKPTRAEVMDVANAVVDGTDAVMLSAETAVGLYPIETVQQMICIIDGAEASLSNEVLGTSESYGAIDESIAMAAISVAGKLEKVKAVACLTASGDTPKLMARARSNLPIYALADSASALGRVALIRGVHPRLFCSAEINYEVVNEAVVARLKEDGTLCSGDLMVLSKGDLQDVQGGTNTLKILEVA